MGQMNLQDRWPKIIGILNKEDGHPQMSKMNWSQTHKRQLQQILRRDLYSHSKNIAKLHCGNASSTDFYYHDFFIVGFFISNFIMHLFLFYFCAKINSLFIKLPWYWKLIFCDSNVYFIIVNPCWFVIHQQSRPTHKLTSVK